MKKRHITFLIIFQCVLMLFSCGSHTDHANDYLVDDPTFVEDFFFIPEFTINDSNMCFAIKTSQSEESVYDTVRIEVHATLKWNEISNNDTSHIVVNGVDTSSIDLWLPIQKDDDGELWWDWDHSIQDNNKVLLALMKDIIDYLMKQTYRLKLDDGYSYEAKDTASWLDVKFDANLSISQTTPESHLFWYSVYGPHYKNVTELKIRQWIKQNKCCQ